MKSVTDSDHVWFGELVEDIPVPEAAVAAKVDLTATDAADGHSDLLKGVAPVDGGQATFW